jgi:hypothetical protein
VSLPISSDRDPNRKCEVLIKDKLLESVSQNLRKGADRGHGALLLTQLALLRIASAK